MRKERRYTLPYRLINQSTFFIMLDPPLLLTSTKNSDSSAKGVSALVTAIGTLGSFYIAYKNLKHGKEHADNFSPEKVAGELRRLHEIMKNKQN